MQKSVIEYLVRTAKRLPEKTALVDDQGSVSFAELLRSAFVIADALHETKVSRSPVGVYIPKSARMIQAFAGINMSGNFYVPLDTKSPDSRIEAILTTLQSEVIITDAAHTEHVRQLAPQCQVVVIDDALQRQPATDADAEQYLQQQISTDAVYSVFTSGSTGTPKGVVIAHQGVIDYIDWAIETFGIDETAVIGNQAPFYFDNSILDIYLMYATGATMDIIPESYFSFPAKLVDYLNDHQINFIFWVPYALINVAGFDILSAKKPQYLRDVFFCGEVMPNKQLNYWRRHLPNCRYANLYGPTEITDACTYYLVDREFTDDEPLPIGKPCRNTEILILVDRQRLAAPGEHGELCVRGTGLAMGYYGDWEKTAGAFIQNPLNKHFHERIYCTGDTAYWNERGEIMYIGRKDAQIKHNGFRIELGEIENAVQSSHMVDNCCIVYDRQNKKIVLFYQAAQDLDLAAFRKAVLTKIPRYMLPSEYHREPALRQNGSGKTDRSYYNKLINNPT
jgi:amino acid adenylation domain-containing protein